MKHLFLLLPALLIATSCQVQNVDDATQAERDMAEMMGITVQELRNQTPEEHMRMMGEMSQRHTQIQGGQNVAGLPEAKPSQIIHIADGDTVNLEIQLVKRSFNGQEFAMYGYNGQIPGPVLQAAQGSTFTVEVKNALQTETTIHWHGIRLENENDGVPGMTQAAIKSGKSFTYTVTVPDEGAYWYHPHVREDMQQDMGLYGNLLVTPSAEQTYNQVNAQVPLLLDDILLSSEGQPVPYGADSANFPLMGRFGNLMLVNGLPADSYALEVERGSVVRFLLANVANTRTFRWRVYGPSGSDPVDLKRVSSDVGRYQREDWVDEVTIAPAERYGVEVLFDTPGTYRLVHESPWSSYEMGTVTVSSAQAAPSYAADFETLRTYEDVETDIAAFRSEFARPVDKTLELDIAMQGAHGMMDHGMMLDHDESGIEWEDTMPGMNAMMTGDDVQWIVRDAATGQENMDIQWNFTVGDTAKIRLVNLADSAHPMQHPIHLHGQRFLVLAVDGKPSTNLVWKDTVLVPTGSTVEILVEMSNPGEWMLHCHIAEHLTNGMMSFFTVSEL